MKNKMLVLVLGLLLSMGTLSMAEGRSIIETRVGGSFAGSYTSQSIAGQTILDDETTGMGYEVAIEGMKEIADNFFLGLGVAYQDHAKTKNLLNDNLRTDEAKVYSSIPVYLTAKYQFDVDSAFKPFVKANFGYSFNIKSNDVSDYASIENGLYYGIGAGVDYNNFVIDLAYQLTTATAENDHYNVKKDAYHDRVTLGLGYRFNL